jgi:protein-S-isoprenylcysteine O-methyltransferase Ste14
LWLIWLVYWGIAAFAAKPVRRRESVGSRISHIVPLLLGIVLLSTPWFDNTILAARFLPVSITGFWAGAALVAIGLLFAVTARVYLGGNWSGTVTLKQDHTLTRGGPYRFVRHPIYTGLLLAVLGNAIAMGQWRGLLALALFLVAFLHKVSVEERFLLEQFGDDYVHYRQEVAALLPLLF